MKLSTRELATLAVFGALWGLVEISLGSVLKTLNIPMSGMVLSAIGLVIALTGRVFVPRRGSTLFIGVIAMLLKLFSLGGVIVGPMVGIISEALVAEIDELLRAVYPLPRSLTGDANRRTLALLASGSYQRHGDHGCVIDIRVIGVVEFEIPSGRFDRLLDVCFPVAEMAAFLSNEPVNRLAHGFLFLVVPRFA